ncbi:hypothetical protein B0T21DRAFT_315458 [Apiosordaria backusii]|uniref:Uncharacterized protein n=1 Tax=Apiosordaria backusii TaxID=314023 RepID=A0AA40B2F6_9PEZI|nr:hypothetical protein B0T21DRAFT_315458 [Apiosordaria backusii]
MNSIQTSLENTLVGERKNWDHNISALPRWVHMLGWLYLTALLQDDNVYKHGWVSGQQGKRLEDHNLPKPVLRSRELASTGLSTLDHVTANLKDIIERSEVVADFIKRTIVEYREGAVRRFLKPLEAAERQMERCVQDSEAMAKAYNNFAACLERTLKSTFPSESHILNSEKAKWVKDAARISKLITAVYYNVLTAAASLKRISDLLKPGLKLRNEPAQQLYTEVLSARARLTVARELAKLFTVAAADLENSLTQQVRWVAKEGQKQYRTQLQGDLRRVDALLEDRKDHVTDAAQQVCEFCFISVCGPAKGICC